jgi:hypothetical protein
MIGFRSRKSALTLAMAALGATVAILSPNWRAALVAQTYYQGGMRMTGGGGIAASGFRHGFALHCDANDLPNRLEVHWGKRQSFRLKTLTDASCTDDPSVALDGTAGFNTFDGKGTGTLNGAPATAEWTFTDGGHGPKNDFSEITITDESGNVVTVSGVLKNGNHLARGG